MDELKDLFGDESLDYATFEQKLTESGIKLANLKGGGYVDKSKYDKLAGEYAKYKTDNDVTKYADYDAIKSELEQLKAEKEELGYITETANLGVAEAFRKFVVSEVKPLVTDKKDFKTCLVEYLAKNGQYMEQREKSGVFFASSVNLNGGESGKKSTNQIMNDFLRSKK